jgi:5,6-dimethylbenzimidazole synthase
MGSAPMFGDRFRAELRELFLWRRDVRRFRRDAVAPELLEALVDLACLAPSVGNSQPWRFVSVEDPARRERVRESFRRCNEAALADFDGPRAAVYARLKLAGLTEAPVHLAVFVDAGTSAGHGLGRKTMPEAIHYSAVAAVHTFWLAARARGLGVGWVSIVDPEDVSTILEVPREWSLVAYLCVGYPEEEHADPELERHEWQARDSSSRQILRR